LLALKAAQDPKIIYEKLNNELKKDPEVLDLVFPESNYHAYASHLTNNYSIQRAQRIYPGRDIIFPQEAHSEVVNFGKKLSPQCSIKKLSPQRSAKNLGGGIKKTKRNKRKTKRI